MTRILCDTNVVLDVLLNREPHVTFSAKVWATVETGKVEGMISAHAVTTIHYLIRKQLGNANAKRIVSSILNVFRVAPVDMLVLDEALNLDFADFEDAVTAAAAKVSNTDWIVTRDTKGFRNSPVRAFTPEAILPILKAP